MGSITFTKPRILQPDDPLEGFSSGTPLIDTWVARHARTAQARGTAVVYASFADGHLAGFYTLSAQSVVRTEVTDWLARNTPEHIPVILLGMLGVDARWQGQGLGHDLLVDATRRSLAVAGEIGARALVVDPLDDAARGFYEHHQFRAIPENNRMYLKLH